MAQFDVEIGTRPLAEKVDVLSASVGAVNLSVMEMTSKLVAAEQMAAENISSNVTYGFYMLTRNQFMQKAITYENEVSTTFMKIQTYSKDLRAIKDRMEKDYNTISRQYLKIFRNIDNSLKQSVSDLDKPLMEIVIQGGQKLTDRRVENTVKAAYYPSDVMPVADAMVIGKLKQRVKGLQHSIFDFIKIGKVLNEKMRHSLSSEKVSGDGETIYFPVVVMESESRDIEDSYVMELQMPNFPKTYSTQSGPVYSKVVDMKDSGVEWVDGSETQRRLVRDEYMRMLSSLPQRKKDLMQKLFDGSRWKELKR